MNRIFLFFLLVFLIVLSFCTEKRPSIQIREKTIDLSGNKGLKFNSIFDSVYYIKLETNAVNIIGNVFRITKSNDKYYVYSFSPGNQEIMIFNSSGKFLAKISKMGNGPGEYPNIISFSVSGNDQVFLYSDASRNIYCYDTTGMFVRKINTGILARDFILLEDHRFVLYSPDEVNSINDNEIPKGIYLLDNNGKYIKNLIKVDPDFENMLHSPYYFTRAEAPASIISSFDDNIYGISNDTAFVKYKLLFINGSKQKEGDLKVNQLSLKGFSQETEMFIYFAYPNFENNRQKHIFIYKNADSVGVYNYLINNLDSMPGNFVGSSDNEVFSIIPNDLYIKLRLQFPGYNKPDIKETDNPVIQVFHLRKHEK
jgi:hypothetical protein